LIYINRFPRRFIFLLGGSNGTEFGEKQNSRRIELQARLYF